MVVAWIHTEGGLVFHNVLSCFSWLDLSLGTIPRLLFEVAAKLAAVSEENVRMFQESSEICFLQTQLSVVSDVSNSLSTWNSGWRLFSCCSCMEANDFSALSQMSAALFLLLKSAQIPFVT